MIEKLGSTQHGSFISSFLARQIQNYRNWNASHVQSNTVDKFINLRLGIFDVSIFGRGIGPV